MRWSVIQNVNIATNPKIVRFFSWQKIAAWRMRQSHKSRRKTSNYFVKTILDICRRDFPSKFREKDTKTAFGLENNREMIVEVLQRSPNLWKSRRKRLCSTWKRSNYFVKNCRRRSPERIQTTFSIKIWRKLNKMDSFRAWKWPNFYVKTMVEESLQTKFLWKERFYSIQAPRFEAVTIWR